MLPDPNDLEKLEAEGTAADLETFIHRCGRHVTDLRELQRRAHVVLERKQSEEYQKEVAARPADFPKPQGIKAGA
jgi:hypothetical protein